MGFKDWSISLKLIVIMVLLGVVAAGSIGTISGVIAKKAIDANMEEHYSSIRDIRIENMANFYSSVIKAADTLAGTSDVENFTVNLVDYHIRKEVRPDDPFPASGEEYSQLWLQGEKLAMLKEAYGYYDVFVICKAHGHVMYSVGKAADLGQNVRVGTLKDAGLGKCWKGVVDSGRPFITDFEPYAPNDNEPSQFVGAPIMLGGEFKHVFVVQVPISQIDTIMQADEGMGETGETYVVGQNHTLRNNSRLQAMDGNAETCLNLTADQDYVESALNGESGFRTDAADYNGQPVLTAFGPFELPESDLRWAMVAEISKEEAYGPIVVMVGWIIGSVILISLIIAAVAMFFGRSIGNPLTRLARSCGIMAGGDFSEQLVTSDAKDEIGQMLRGFKEMQENTAGLIRQVGDAATNLASASEQLSANADETGRAVQDVARTVEEVAKGSAETNSNVENVAAAIIEAASQGEEGKKFATQTNDIMQRATGSIDSTATVISALGDKTAQIEEFIGIITGIADQTNLLALNAAIEAARAGEAGRGFAVVAEEVRKLAEESNNAAGNITQMIHGIKAEMQVALDAMDCSKGEVTEGANMVMQTSEMLSEIVEGVSKLSSQVDTIASIATENSAAAEEVSSTTEEQTASMEEIGANSSTLAKLAQELSSMVERFQV